MVDPNGYIEDEDVEDADMLGEGSESGIPPSLDENVLDEAEIEAMEEDGSLHSEESIDPVSQDSGSGHGPVFAASPQSSSLGRFGQSVRLNTESETGSLSWRPSIPTPGFPGYGVLARPTPGVITEIDPKEAARERSLAETMASLIGNPPRPDENTITLGPVGFALAQGVYHPATPWSLKEANQFMATHLKLDTQQDVQLNSDLRQENFLSEYEKLPQLQAILRVGG